MILFIVKRRRISKALLSTIKMKKNWNYRLFETVSNESVNDVLTLLFRGQKTLPTDRQQDHVHWQKGCLRCPRLHPTPLTEFVWLSEIDRCCFFCLTLPTRPNCWCPNHRPQQIDWRVAIDHSRICCLKNPNRQPPQFDCLTSIGRLNSYYLSCPKRQLSLDPNHQR